MGCHALTAATCIVMRDVVNFPAHIIRQQIVDVVAKCHPRAVKVGLVRTPEAVGVVSNGIVGMRRIVVAPGIMASNNVQLVDDDTIDAIRRCLIPVASLLVLRQVEAEKILGVKIVTDNDMVAAAQSFIDMGAEYVMIRGGRISEGRVTALLLGNDVKQFFSSYNIEGWKQHGVGGALSTAVATRLGMGDDVPDAVRNAHEFVHSRIVYSVSGSGKRMRPADIYNAFMNLLSNNYQRAHDVAFYADRLCITTRYLSQITNESVSKSPKQIIAEYLLNESRQVLENSRLSVKEVSDNLGFRAVSVFCKLFKQQMGFTPSEYRRHIVR
jgi:hydroxymethylpyrimidine/phosphomethylpyrimidine kinase